MSKFYFGLVLIICISCSTRNEKKITKLNSRFYNVKIQFEKIDPNLVISALEGYKSNFKMIKKCVDSVEEEFNHHFVQYKTIKKISPKFFNTYNTCKKNIIFEDKQLKNLKHDVENKFLGDDSTRIYLDMEIDNVNQIENNSLKAIELYNYIKSNNDTLYPYVSGYIEKYCNKNAN